MIKYDGESKTLVIELGDRTRAKLFSLAALSAKSIEAILQEALSELSDKILESLEDKLSHEIVVQLESMDGKSVTTTSAQIQRAEEEEFQQEGELAKLSHQLSGDEDTGENYSLAEQTEGIQQSAPAHRNTRHAPQDFQDDSDNAFQTGVRIPDVGSNADAFLDATMNSEREDDYNQGRVVPTRQRGISRAFNPKQRQARVSEYTGDDSDDSQMRP